MTSRLPQSLLTAAAKHRLIPLAGAGVSMSVCRDDGQPLFPSWKDLLFEGAQLLIRELDNNRAQVVEGFLNIGEYTKAADVLKEGLTGERFSDWIQHAIDRSYAEVMADSLALPQTLWELGSQLILTTNYDRVLRWACPRQHDLREWSRVPRVNSIAELVSPTVWHLHGNVNDPGDIVLSNDDYQKLYRGDSVEAVRFQTLFQDILRDKTLLFVGFSLHDPYLENQLEWLQQYFPGKGHYLLAESAQFEETRQRLAKFKNLSFVSYAAHGAPLIEVLATLRETASSPDRYLAVNTSPVPERGEPLEGYLGIANRANGVIRLPGMDRLVPIEQVWVKPAFITTGGETKLHKVLGNKAVVIDAPAGAGKSTLARFISAVLARDRLGILPPAGISWQEEFLDVQPGPVRHVPLLVKSADIDSELGTEGILRAASPPLSQSELEELRPLLERGDVVFIVDGLDEVSSIDRTRITQSLAAAREQWGKTYFLVTTRGGDYQLPEHLGFTHAKLTSVSPEDARQLLRRWTQALFPDPAESARVLTKIQVALGRTHELQPMLSSPLSVAFLCWNYLTAMTLPTSRASLYENVSSWLLESRSGQRLTAGIDTETTQKTLEAFAFSLLIGMDDRGPVASAEIQGLLAQTSTVLGLSADKVERVIRVEASLGSCIEDDHGRIRFWHLSLRDYFAARWLLRRQLSSTPQLAQEIESALWNPAWKECVDLFVGLLAIHHSQQVEPFLDVLGSLSGLSLQNRIRTAALRSRVLDIAIAHGYKPTPGYRESLVAQFDKTVQLSEPQIADMSLEERVAVFSSLGVLQVDRRLRGKPSGRALVLRGDSSVTMGRYPVTVQEFARFVRAGAYENLKWSRDYQAVWHGWRAPLSWEEQKLMPNAPVVGVSWHEAVAYCRWLTEEDENVCVRLATMKEWREAVGDTKDETNIPRGAVSNDRFLPITPIGIRPERRGPNGHEDLGLIWEWLGQRSKSSRRNRLQMTADGELTPQWRNQRGAHRSPIAGFRIVLERLT